MITELSLNPVKNKALPLQFIMVTGTSGSGKTQALKCLEDLVFDVRFLRNPHFVPDLQPLTGEHADIQQFVLDNKEGKDFLRHLQELFEFLLPLFEREQRTYLTIAFGCTGGRHRSVSMAIHMKDILKTLGYDITLRHREIHTEHVEAS